MENTPENIFIATLERKIELANMNIIDWYTHFEGQVYVSFSGGKDSTVLLHMVRKLYPDVEAVFCDTGLEYPEIRGFVKTIDNVRWLKPDMNFKQVLKKYGYPIISKESAQKLDEIRHTKSCKLKNKRMYGGIKGSGKLPEKWRYMIDAPFKISHKCCNVMKKKPFALYEKETNNMPMIGITTDESGMRRTSYDKMGCNAFNVTRPRSWPMAMFNDNDIWNYIKKFDVAYSEIYDMGADRTGCMFCMFGLHLENKPNRFDRMKISHPKQYKFCMENLGLKDVLEWYPEQQRELF